MKNQGIAQTLFSKIKNSTSKFRKVLLLLLISFFSFSAACTFAGYGSLRENGTAQFNVEKLFPFALKTNGKIMFKSSIDVYGRHFSGIMFVKFIGEHHYRIVFLTEVGLGIFDYELDHGIFTEHASVEMMKDDRIRSILQNDLKLIFLEADSSGVADHYYDSVSGNAVYRVKSGDAFNYYYCDSTGMINKIEHSTSCFKKVAVGFSGLQGNPPVCIKVNHFDINLVMEFVEMKKDAENE